MVTGPVKAAFDTAFDFRAASGSPALGRGRAHAGRVAVPARGPVDRIDALGLKLSSAHTLLVHPTETRAPSLPSRSHKATPHRARPFPVLTMPFLMPFRTSYDLKSILIGRRPESGCGRRRCGRGIVEVRHTQHSGKMREDVYILPALPSACWNTEYPLK